MVGGTSSDPRRRRARRQRARRRRQVVRGKSSKARRRRARRGTVVQLSDVIDRRMNIENAGSKSKYLAHLMDNTNVIGVEAMI